MVNLFTFQYKPQHHQVLPIPCMYGLRSLPNWQQLGNGIVDSYVQKYELIYMTMTETKYIIIIIHIIGVP